MFQLEEDDLESEHEWSHKSGPWPFPVDQIDKENKENERDDVKTPASSFNEPDYKQVIGEYETHVQETTDIKDSQFSLKYTDDETVVHNLIAE